MKIKHHPVLHTSLWLHVFDNRHMRVGCQPGKTCKRVFVCVCVRAWAFLRNHRDDHGLFLTNCYESKIHCLLHTTVLSGWIHIPGTNQKLTLKKTKKIAAQKIHSRTQTQSHQSVITWGGLLPKGQRENEKGRWDTWQRKVFFTAKTSWTLRLHNWSLTSI